MKNLIFASVVLSLVLFAASCIPGEKPVETHKPGEVYVYEFEPIADLTPGDSRKMVETYLGVTPSKDLYRSEEGIAYFVSDEDVNVTLEHDLKTGNLTFNKSLQAYLGDAVPQLPSKNDAPAIAEAYLKANGLLPKNAAEFVLVHNGGLRAASVIDGKRAGAVIDKMITLTYGRRIDSLPVFGPGSKMVVHIGEKGEVTGLIHRWRELSTSKQRRVNPEETYSQEEALKLLAEQIRKEYGENSSYEVLSTTRAYYDNNGKWLQPVYAFQTRIILPIRQERQIVEYLAIIPLLKKEQESLNLFQADPRASEKIRAGERGLIPPADSKISD